MLKRIARLLLFGGIVSLITASWLHFAAARSATAISPDLFSGLRWHCIGPFDGGPVASVTGEPGVPGVYVVTTPTGGVWKTIDAGDTWSTIETAPPPGTDRWVDPGNSRRIVRTDAKGIEVSLDAGQTWLASHRLPIADVARIEPREHPAEPAGRRQIAGKPATVSIVDPARPGLVFAGTADAVYVSFDNGGEWQSLKLNMPGVTINDLDIRGRDLVAATSGRSTWQLDDITPLRQLSTTSAPVAAMLFKPADGVLSRPDVSAINIDYYIGSATRGDIVLEIANATGRVVHAATSAAADPTDRWLPVTRPLSSAAGHHRVSWNLRFDPPPAQKHRYAQFARAAFEDMPPDPDGPRVLAGTYRIKLTVAGQSYSQTAIVRDDSRATPASLADAKREFDFAMKIYDAMQITHRAFRQLASVRAGLKPLLTSTNDQTAALATNLDARLVQLDGTDWTGLLIPDEDQDDFDPDEAEEQGIKHPDFIVPRPVSVSKDYDDPTSVLGRKFANINHAPALTIVSSDLGTMLTKAMTTPDVVAAADYDRSCQQLSGVLDAWRAINSAELAGVNAELAKQKLAPLPIAGTVPAIACK